MMPELLRYKFNILASLCSSEGWFELHLLVHRNEDQTKGGTLIFSYISVPDIPDMFFLGGVYKGSIL